MNLKKSKIFVAGHKGLVGSAVVRRLKYHGFKNIITATKSKLDLTNQKTTLMYLKKISQNILLYVRLKLVEFLQTIHSKVNLFIIIYKFKII